MTDRPIHRLLILEESYSRLSDRLPGPDLLQPIFPDVANRTAQPTIAWYNHDLYARSGTPPHDRFLKMMRESTGLEWVQSSAAGTDNPLFEHILDKGARLSTSHAQAPAIAEYVLSAVLDHFQNAAQRRRAQAGRSWQRISFRELRGSRWLIVGFGEIGQHVARLARAFGCHITAARRSTQPTDPADSLIDLANLSQAITEADVTVLCLPLTDATRGLIDAQAVSAFAAGSVLVNVGRGGLIDEDALIAGLDRARPAHAILDVFAVEPLPGDSPFWHHPAVSLSAHTSAAGSGTGTRNDALFLENLDRFLQGKSLRHEVRR